MAAPTSTNDRDETRKTIAAQLNHADDNEVDGGASQLFKIVDTDKSGNISKTEFADMYAEIRAHVVKEHKIEREEHEARLRAQRRAKMMGITSAVLVVFLGVSIAGNAAATYAITDLIKDTRTTPSGSVETGGISTLTDKNTGAVVATHEMPTAPLATPSDFPEYSAARLKEIKTLNLTFADQTAPGITHELVLSVLGYRKTVCAPNTACDPKKHSSVTFHCDGLDVMHYYDDNGNVVEAYGYAEGMAADVLMAAGGLSATTVSGRRLVADKIGALEVSHPLKKFQLDQQRKGRELWAPLIWCAMNPAGCMLVARAAYMIICSGFDCP